MTRDTREEGSTLSQEDPLEYEMATHSSTLAWKIPWTERRAWQATVHEVAKSQTRLSTHTLKGKVGSSGSDLDTHQAPRRMTERELVLGPTFSIYWLCDLEQVISSL